MPSRLFITSAVYKRYVFPSMPSAKMQVPTCWSLSRLGREGESARYSSATYRMSSVDLGPISVSVLTLSCAVVGTAFFCCIFYFLSPRYTDARTGRAVPFGGKHRDPAEEGTIWPQRRAQMPV